MSGIRHRFAALWSASLVVSLTFPSATALAANGDCGIPFTSGNSPKTSDCLFVLRAGVGVEDCANCVCDTDGNGVVSASDALLCLRYAVGQGVELLCPICDASGTCPGTVEWQTHAGLGQSCSENADCDAGRCDPATDRCETETNVDIGWTGHGHHADLGDSPAALRVNVDCGVDEAPCAECEIQGIDPSDGACRCSNATLTLCDDAFEVDSDDCPTCVAGAFVGKACGTNTDCQAGLCTRRCSNNLAITCENSGDCPEGACEVATQCSNGKECLLDIECMGTCTGGALCRCYDGAPIAMSAGGEPYCLVQRLASDVTGTVNVDTGAAGVVESLQLLVHLGISEGRPCPVCGGRCDGEPGQPCESDDECGAGDVCLFDALPQDGVRGGDCIGGANDGMPCDPGSASVSFPATPESSGGGRTSLDCLPSTGLNLSGSAQVLAVTLSTEDSELSANLSCGGANDELSCPCLVCSTNPAQGCRSDADCLAESGSCSASAAVLCETNADCTGIDGGACLDTDKCENAPLISCANDGDCDVVSVGTCQPATCSGDGDAGFPSPNACDDGFCTDDGGGHGECTTGPDDLFCDDLLTADGSGLIACTDNADCPTHVIETMSGGTCSLLQRRRCFLDPIVASGDGDPHQPVLAAAFCMAPTLSLAINENLGLPGPVRQVRQTSQFARCATAPSQFYGPGIGGCPP